MVSPALPRLSGRPLRWPLRLGRTAAAARARGTGLPGRRGLQVCLGLVWLLDAGLQYQPYMFGPFFVTQVIQPASAGTPSVVAGPATWASQLMLHHIAIYNAVFATIQLLIGAGIVVRRTARPALAASVVWALAVWWLGESLGGILSGASPLAGLPGGVVLYALIAVLLWPAARPAPRHATAGPRPAGPQPAGSAATSGLLGAKAPRILWFMLWGSFSYFLLLPANRAPGAISGLLSVTDGQPGWAVSVMNALASLAGQRGTEICVVLAAACALVAAGVFSQRTLRPALAAAAVLGLLFWIAEGFGGIFTGQGTDPSTGPLLILLAACFCPRPGHRSATWVKHPRRPGAMGETSMSLSRGPAGGPHTECCQCDPGQGYQRAEDRPERRAGHETAADDADALERENDPGDGRQQADDNEQPVLHQ